MSDGEWRGRTVLVTGAGSGIGRSIATAFAAAGATVALVGRRVEALEETVALIAEGCGVATAFAADVTQEAAVVDVLARLGRFDAGVNAAGIFSTGAVDTMDADAFAQILSVNLTGTWLAMKHQIRALKAFGGGAIVNIGSNIGGRTVRPGLGAYAASKAAVLALTRTAALEAIAQGVRINCLSPGPVDTPMSLRPGEDRAARDARIAATNPSGRVAQPAEIAAAALWLASDAAAYIVGQEIVIDGGAST